MTDAAMDKSPPPQATIDINLGKLQQLFNSLDPSPFHDRDLDHDAEEYIVARAEEIARHRPLKLVIICRRSSWEAPIRLLWNVPYTITLPIGRSSHSAGCVLFSMMDVSPLL